MPWHFGILAAAAAAAGLGIALNEGGLVPGVLFPIGSTLFITWGAVQLMKIANRSAQRRIAAGEFPDMPALRPGHSDDAGEDRAATV